MAGLLVTPEQLAEAARMLDQAAISVEQIVAAARSQAEPVQNQWRGVAALKANQLADQLASSSAELTDTLRALSALFAQASASYAETEQAIASSFD